MMDRQPLSKFSVPGRKVWFWRFSAGLLLATLAAWGIFSWLILPASAAPMLQATAVNAVISEFRTQRPGPTNPASDEFIGLFNPTNASVDISGWKIMGASSTGSPGTT